MKDVEKRDAVLTSDKQIERLVKPGSKYLNLNPYEVSSNINESMDILLETNQAEGIEKICMLSLCLVSITVSALAPP